MSPLALLAALAACGGPDGSGNPQSTPVTDETEPAGACSAATIALEPAPVLEVSGNGYGLAAGDLDGDGLADLVVPLMMEDALAVYYSLGDGTFSPVDEVGSSVFPMDLAIADLDPGGANELVVTSAFDVSVYAAGGNGDLRQVTARDVLGFSVFTVVLDADADGALDVAVTVDESGIALYTGDGDGGLADGVLAVDEPSLDGTIAAGDIDNDGHDDVVAVRGDEVVSYLSVDGAFEVGSTTLTSGDYPELGLADLDGDGLLDLLASTAGGVSWHTGRGDGTFGEANDVPAVGELAVETDLDCDGDPDLAVGDGDGVDDLAAGSFGGGRQVGVILNRSHD